MVKNRSVPSPLPTAAHETDRERERSGVTEIALLRARKSSPTGYSRDDDGFQLQLLSWWHSVIVDAEDLLVVVNITSLRRRFDSLVLFAVP